MLLLFENQLTAQSQPEAPSELLGKETTVSKEQNLDTEESIKYMGSELLFQFKKRLHLTSEEEEKEKEKEKKPVSFTIFGVKIEKG